MVLIIKELMKALSSMKERNLEVHKKLLIESQQCNEIYTQILSAIRKQNLMLDDLRESGKVVAVAN